MSRRSLAQIWAYKVSRITARLLAVLYFGIRCWNRDRLPDAGGALVCSNHQSFLDPVLVGLACDRRINYLARDTLFTYPFFGRLIRFFDAIPIQRDGFGLSGFKETLRRLRRGEIVLVFPEGTRTRDGEVAPFHSGVCALARRARVPLVPVGMDGAFDSWRRGTSFPRPERIHIHFGFPISVLEIEDLTDARLIGELEKRLKDCHAQSRITRSLSKSCEIRGEPSVQSPRVIALAHPPRVLRE